MPYSVLYGLSIAQIMDDFATAEEAIARLAALRSGNAAGIMILDGEGAEITEADLNARAATEGGDGRKQV
ncbi:MAG: hypothetical protein J0I79_18850 [Mesorhizobium sp.]|uniref:hypothetical protein n=1 Tax=Mesorhizobium sp. TaxID=1871066 RepID=UPI001AC17F5E|nr:hypothetical protein [Mesorhizobium sp.]MBN9220007.1 hypothetical protein [Mesorhizobium sp.]